MADWGSPHCSCGCREKAPVQDGCPCKECQPGSGIDFHRGAKHIVRRNTELMAAGRHQDVRWAYMPRR